MNCEKKFVLAVLADYLARRLTEQVSGLDWQEIMDLAQKHQIGGIIWTQCREFMPSEAKADFGLMYDKACYAYMKRQVAWGQLSAAFREEGIDFFPIKGLDIAKYYPHPVARTMGDLDLVIHREDRGRADELMRAHGFQNTSHFENREWVYFKDGLEYELHDRLIYDEQVNRAAHVEFFNQCWPYVEHGKLDVSFHFLFLLSHLRKHFMNSGVGFRQFMDIAIMAEKEPALNWPWICARLEELDLLRFAAICAGFIQRWFGISIPIDAESPEEEFYEQATERVFANGIFGFDDAGNEKNLTINAARQSDNPASGLIGRARDAIFPSYDTLRVVPAYHFVENRPWLVPAAWVYRCCRGMKKYSATKKILSNLYASSDIIKERDEYLTRWGL